MGRGLCEQPCAHEAVRRQQRREPCHCRGVNGVACVERQRPGRLLSAALILPRQPLTLQLLPLMLEWVLGWQQRGQHAPHPPCPADGGLVPSIADAYAQRHAEVLKRRVPPWKDGNSRDRPASVGCGVEGHHLLGRRGQQEAVEDAGQEVRGCLAGGAQPGRELGRWLRVGEEESVAAGDALHTDARHAQPIAQEVWTLGLPLLWGKLTDNVALLGLAEAPQLPGTKLLDSHLHATCYTDACFHASYISSRAICA